MPSIFSQTDFLSGFPFIYHIIYIIACHVDAFYIFSNRFYPLFCLPELINKYIKNIIYIIMEGRSNHHFYHHFVPILCFRLFVLPFGLPFLIFSAYIARAGIISVNENYCLISYIECQVKQTTVFELGITQWIGARSWAGEQLAMSTKVSILLHRKSYRNLLTCCCQGNRHASSQQ